MDLMQRRRELMAMQSGGLPGAYQKVEYIQTQGGGTYINTGILMSDDLVFEIDFQLIEIIAGRYFMGVYGGTSFYLYLSSSAASSIYFQTAFGTTWANTTLEADTNRHNFIYSFSNGNVVVESGNEVIFERKMTSMNTNPILVAGAQPSTSVIPVKTFSSKMSRGGVVIQNLVPCIRKSDNKPGMYDTVSKTFYTNAGTGEFIVPN